MITVEAKRLGTRVIATVKVGISTGRYTYTVQFADQGSEAANEVSRRNASCVEHLKKSSKRSVHRE
jgi:hypothetical protein